MVEIPRRKSENKDNLSLKEKTYQMLLSYFVFEIVLKDNPLGECSCEFIIVVGA
jgi:hypothetical protein